MNKDSFIGLYNWISGPEAVVHFQRICGVKWYECNKDVSNSVESNRVSNVGRHKLQDHHTYNLREREHPINSQTNNEFASSRIKNDSENLCVNKIKINNRLLYLTFLFASNLGNEIFYISFFPFFYWNVDCFVARRVCVIWVVTMYIGQAAKDIIKRPRPPSPPVICLEQHYALEYGFPSTHTMVGASIPFSLLMLTMERYDYPLWLGLTGALLWCGLVATSRLYLGVHSILDVLAGLFLIAIMLPTLLPCLDTLDRFQLLYTWSPAIIPLITLTMCICYPTLNRWSTARGDTTIILAVGTGMAIGNWINYQSGFIYLDTTISLPLPVHIPSLYTCALAILRFIIGLSVLMVTRVILKSLTRNVICKYLRIDSTSEEAKETLIVELPYKFLTYTVIAINVTYLCPVIFMYLGISRDAYYMEVGWKLNA